MSPELAFYQTGGAFFWTAFLFIAAAGSCALLLGLFVLLQAAAPGLIGRAGGAHRERPILSLATGAAITAALVALASAGRAVPPAGAVAVSVFATLGLFGLAATAENVGRRVAWMAGRESSRVTQLALGWIVLFPAACVPFVGWFLIAPWAVTSGIGSLTLGACRGAESSRSQTQ